MDAIKINQDIPFLYSDSPILTVGRLTYGRPKILSWMESDRVSIGSFCSIASNVVIFAGSEHRSDWMTTSPIRILFDLPEAWKDGCPMAKGETIIGNDVWIGYGAFILSGVKIGSGAVIGAGAVVSKDVEPYAVVAGNPACIKKYRFNHQMREVLLQLKWWDWPSEKIIDNVDILCSDNVEKLKLLVDMGRL